MAVKKKVGHLCDMIKDQPQFRIRLPADLKAQVEEFAAASGRSLNAEIVARLAESVRRGHTEQSARLTDTDMARFVGTMLGKFETIKGMSVAILESLGDGIPDVNLKAMAAATALYSIETARIANQAADLYFSDKHSTSDAISYLNQDIRETASKEFVKAWDFWQDDKETD